MHKLCFSVYCNIVATHIHTGHNGHIHIILSSWFYLIIVTSRNSLPHCEHDPSYQERSQSNLVKVGKVQAGFKHNFKKQLPKVFYKKKAFLKNFAIFIKKHFCWTLFLTNLQAYKPATLLQRDSNTGVFLLILRNFKKNLF